MRICIPIRENSPKKALFQVRRANRILKKWPNSFLEIWLDVFSQDDVKKILLACKRPIIAVCRGAQERGFFQGSEKTRIEKLLMALSVKKGLFIDIGGHTSKNLVKTLKNTCKKARANLIISHHFWKKTPRLKILENLVKKSRANGADIVKIATYITCWADNVVLFELTRRMAKNGVSLIAVGMGKKGRISRIGCPLLGSFLTYAALDGRSKTAPGQLTLQDVMASKAID